MTFFFSDCPHTPLCDASCNIDHHHVILTLYNTSNKRNPKGKNSFIQLLENSKYNFLSCLKKHLEEGMAKDLDISDGLVKLRYPLVHLAAMFYRYVVIDVLACLGFARNVRSPRTGEFPLHSTLRHNYETGVKLFKTILQPGFIDMTFAKVFDSLSSGIDIGKLLTQQDRNGDTPLHVAAKMMIKRPIVAANSSAVPESEIPDSTQECDAGSSQVHQPLHNPSLSCKLQKATKEHKIRAEFYMSCMRVMCRKIHESAIRNRKLVYDLVKPVLLVKNNDGETFLQILCKEHHVTADCICAVLTRFPLDVFINCVKECIPKCCWPVGIPSERVKKSKSVSDVHQTEPVTWPVEFSGTSKRQAGKELNKFIAMKYLSSRFPNVAMLVLSLCPGSHQFFAAYSY